MRRTIVTLLILFFLWPSSAWAQTDPAGYRLAEEIYDAMESGEGHRAVGLFNADQKMSIRAFLSVLEFVCVNIEGNPEEATEAAEFAVVLAQQAQESWNDPMPMQILELFGEEDPRVVPLFAQYSAQYYSGYATVDVLGFLNEQGSSPDPATSPTQPSEFGPTLTEAIARFQVKTMRLGETSIVTLSACSTALADTKDVEFVASLAEAFWIAGSNSVVASLWQVDDNSTGLLMTNFYKHMKAGSGRGEALRKAQLEVRENPKFAHPYFWSGFLLFGEYR